jgi:hypothetical protein
VLLATKGNLINKGGNGKAVRVATQLLTGVDLFGLGNGRHRTTVNFIKNTNNRKQTIVYYNRRNADKSL